MVVEGFGWVSGGVSNRPVGFCGHPWQEWDRGLLNGVFQCYKAQKTHTHKHRGRSNVLSENVAYPALDQMELSG